jgi:subtilisin-like proprotein convertase family protein
MRSMFSLIFLFAILEGGFSQHVPAFWTATSRPAASTEPHVHPSSGAFYALDLPALIDWLGGPQGGQLELPDPEGRLRRFQVEWAPAAEAPVYARYPELGTYRIHDPSNPLVQGRMDHTRAGFHAMYFDGERTVMIDPVYRGRTDRYAVYFKDAYWEDPAHYPSFQCENEEALPLDEAVGPEEMAGAGLRSDGIPVTLLRYRIAIATTGEYSQYHGGAKPLVLAELVTAVNRLNAVLERDMGLSLVLVADNEKIIFLDPLSDGFTNGETGMMINEVTGRIGQFIKFDDYDIGHVFGVATNGNVGLAQLGCVCTSSKARGVSGLWVPKFDPFYINVVAHEIGHQYAATHSFNKCINESPGTGWEPGGGSTIMSYSGSCGTNSVQNNAHDYYHGGSLRQMKLFVRQDAGSECPERIATNNTEPEVTLNYSNGFVIPISTPFRLEAQAFDAEGDALTYCWEGMDTGPISDAGNPQLESPLFRTWPPTPDSFRYFPRIQNVAQKVYNKFEHLPDYTRELNFRVSVRDNNPEAGGLTQKDVRFSASEEAGPFRVLSFSTPDSVRQGDYVEVLWDVAGTDQAPVSCERVNIRLSTNGGLTFPWLLAENVPNEGSFFVTIPTVITTGARVMVEAADNVFYQMSQANLRVIPPLAPNLLVGLQPFQQQACLPAEVVLSVVLDTLAGWNGPVTLTVSGGLPPGATAVFDQTVVVPPASIPLRLDLSGVTQGGLAEILVTATAANGQSWTRPTRVGMVRSTFSELQPLAPAPGAGGISTSPLLRWSATADAERYRVELATSPAFGSATILTAGPLTDTSLQVLMTLDANRLYFWRILPENRCGQWSEPPVYAFHTVSLNCTEYVSTQEIFIPSQGTHTIQSVIQVPASGATGSVWVPRIHGSHQNIGQLRGTLRSPSGKTVRLFSNKCFTVGGNLLMGFNEDSQQEFLCPPDKGQVYPSQESLTAFNGEEAEGPWTLIIDDIATGASGTLSGWRLSLCSDANPSPPYFLNRHLLLLAPGQTAGITPQLLMVGDDNNQPWELTFTLVRTPRRGLLRRAGAVLAVGHTFTQQDIYDGLMSYEDTSGTEGEDDFLFTVQDGEGGWLDISAFEIRTDAALSTVGPLGPGKGALILYPNPAGAETTLVWPAGLGEHPQIRVFHIQGGPVPVQVAFQDGQRATIRTGSLAPGYYVVHLTGSGQVLSASLLIAP